MPYKDAEAQKKANARAQRRRRGVTLGYDTPEGVTPDVIPWSQKGEALRAFLARPRSGADSLERIQRVATRLAL